MTDILLRARCHHLTAGTVHGSHDLPGARGLLVLHALPAHHEGVALVTLLRGEDKVSRGDDATTSVCGHLERISYE